MIYPEVLHSLPVRVLSVEVQDPIITLVGDGWSLNVMCPWTGVARGQEQDWTDDGIGAWVRNLIGQELVTITEEGPSVLFGFTDGVMKVTPDTDLDPWALRLPVGVMVGRIL